MKTTTQRLTPFAIEGNRKTSNNGDAGEPSVRIQFHPDGGYSTRFSREFLRLPRDIRREVMKQAVKAKLANSRLRFWSTEIGSNSTTERSRN
jgi:hypothetical protein